MASETRRRFLSLCTAAATGAWLEPALASEINSSPNLKFPSEPHERIAIASYPFREFMSGGNGGNPIDLKDFPAHVIERFNIHKIEPWGRHFTSTDPKYLEEFRAALDKARTTVVNIPTYNDYSPYAVDRLERERAIAFNKKWVDVALAIGSPSIRSNPRQAKGAKPDLGLLAGSLTRLVEYASAKNIVVTLENDNPVDSDPFFMVQVIERVNSPWLRALPDFGNTLAARDPDYAYRGLGEMFAHAYCISHVKSSETNGNGATVHVDMGKAFGCMKQHGYKGYCSMEWDDKGDPYLGTEELINTTLRYL
jgi:sugar phosphate isomerase/epimerase